jgi:hypothetical protein
MHCRQGHAAVVPDTAEIIAVIAANAGAFRYCSTSDPLDRVQKATISYF